MIINNAEKRGFLFDEIKVSDVKKTAFDTGFENKLTMQMGKIVPCVMDEVLPATKLTCNIASIARFEPLIAPLMHRIDMYYHMFFIPNRLVWSHWKEFISPGDGKVTMLGLQDYVPPVKPYVTMYTIYQLVSNNNLPWTDCPLCVGSLGDYLGLNFSRHFARTDEGKRDYVMSVSNALQSTQGAVQAQMEAMKIDLLPFMAYQLVYDEYYRNEALAEPYLTDDIKDIQGEVTDPQIIRRLFALRTRAWNKDYFTSCLPTPQAGKPVMIDGLETNMSSEKFQLHATYNGSEQPGLNQQAQEQGAVPLFTWTPPMDDQKLDPNSNGSIVKVAVYNSNDGMGYPATAYFKMLKKDGSELTLPSTAFSVNQLRKMIKFQEFLEKTARAGSRYKEQLTAHFGVFSSDARLQRPEFIGGGKQAVTISPIEQTSETANTPQGNLSGKATSVGNDVFGQYGESEEHGFFMVVTSVMPKTGYFQGIPKMFQRFDYLDYAFPEFAHLGEQEVKTKEIYFDYLNNDTNESTFGYIPRYSEYKYLPDQVHGYFKDSLNYWHLARKFADAPVLNDAFVRCEPRNDIFAVIDDTEHQIEVDMYVDYKAIKPLPKFGTPHF